jgi:uncharacterized zinc-type alcohol dehydrogenase-like protein
MTIVQQNMPSKTSKRLESVGYGTSDAKSPLKKMIIQREFASDYDVMLSVMFCGVCHSDIHQARDEWHNTLWPCVPGHELVGRVSGIGAKVTNFVPGDLVGVGCMINSCGKCDQCTSGEEQYCQKGFLATYNGPFNPNGTNTFGGYSDTIIAHENFVVLIPKTIAPEQAAPLLCSAVTSYSPMKHWEIGPQHKVAIVGIGGLGHVAIQIAKALGADVTAITATLEKVADAKKLGASDVIISTDEQAMQAHAATFDFILTTIPTKHDTTPYLRLLKHNGTMTIIGCLEKLEPGSDAAVLAFKRVTLAGSLIGSIAETKEVLEFCAAHKIAPIIQMIGMNDINWAFDRVVNNKVRYCYVIDMRSLSNSGNA